MLIFGTRLIYVQPDALTALALGKFNLVPTGYKYLRPRFGLNMVSRYVTVEGEPDRVTVLSYTV